MFIHPATQRGQSDIIMDLFFRFYLPHGLTIDHEDNIWLTDVAMHMVSYQAECRVVMHMVSYLAVCRVAMYMVSYLAVCRAVMHVMGCYAECRVAMYMVSY